MAEPRVIKELLFVFKKVVNFGRKQKKITLEYEGRTNSSLLTIGKAIMISKVEPNPVLFHDKIVYILLDENISI